MSFRGVAECFDAVEIIFMILNQNGISCMVIYFKELKRNIYNYNKNKTRKHSFEGGGGS